MDGLTVGIPTFGDPKWIRLAHERAIPSAQAQGSTVLHRHRETLCEARNAVLEDARTAWLVNLDADDELELGYGEAMGAATADVRAPVVRYMENGRGRMWQPRVAGHQHDCTAACLGAGNWVVVGAAVRTDLLREIGGWRDHAWSEDWSTWARCYKAGASFELVRGAVYRAHVDRQSRNRAPGRELKDRVHWEIHRDVWPELYEDVA